MKAEEIMTKEVKTTQVPGNVEKIFNVFKEGKHTGLPVLKKGTNKVVGVITRSDLLRNPNEDQIAMIMTRNPTTIRKDTEINEIASLINNKEIRRLPVVEENDELAGIVSVADLVDVISNKGIKRGISKFMNGSCTSTWTKTPVPVVAEVMRLSMSDAVPVLDDDCKVTGIVSDTDLVKSFKIEDELERSDIGSASDEDDWTWDGVRDTLKFYYGVSKFKLPNVAVEEIMTENVVSAFIGSTVEDVAQKMNRNQIEQIPILDEENRLVGLIRDRDLIKALI
ncbi:MAG: CBS domain containing protein [Candidatus Methanohalarchaeum thermophilum]|uniref:CBS domain containing protein n=1 Tax=Methanohalarchaeum thermophilum TaxID=1903181 RepID=A0A1Q6DTH9_METT1|nr:MAG: CBS domain containing protein [Candidatus Methanohalarchaeum thermophilum]